MNGAATVDNGPKPPPLLPWTQTASAVMHGLIVAALILIGSTETPAPDPIVVVELRPEPPAPTSAQAGGGAPPVAPGREAVNRAPAAVVPFVPVPSTAAPESLQPTVVGTAPVPAEAMSFPPAIDAPAAITEPQPAIVPPAPPPPLPKPKFRPKPARPAPLAAAVPERPPSTSPEAPAVPPIAGTGQGGSTAAAPGAAGAGRGDGEGTAATAFKDNPPPPYPEAAVRRGMEGTVTLRIAVSADGLPTRIEVAQSSGFKPLDEAARFGAERWRFQPARHGGAAVASTVVTPVRFSLKGSPE